MNENIAIAQGIFDLVWALFLLITIVDIVRSDFKDHGKLKWFFIVVMTFGIGGFFYWSIGRKEKMAKHNNNDIFNEFENDDE